MKEQQELFAKARQALSNSTQGLPAPPKPAGPSDADLMRQQQELFAQARARAQQAQQSTAAPTSDLIQVGAPQPPQ